MAGQAEDKMSGNVEVTTRMGATHHEMGKDQHISHLMYASCLANLIALNLIPRDCPYLGL